MTLFVYTDTYATIYYVDNKSGGDLNNGTSVNSAWKTIRKVNSAHFSPGDEILFRAGIIWNEKLEVPSSGVLGQTITFGRYGSGVKPLISGLQTLSGFKNTGNIWTTTTITAVLNLNTVLVNGSIRAKGRYPNTGYLTFTDYRDKDQVTGSLSGTPNYTGAEIVVRSAHWMIDMSKITSQSVGTLNFLPALTYTPNNGCFGYFIQNSALVLDTLNEWYYNDKAKIFSVYSNSSPTVQISTIDTLISLNNKQYITFDNLNFQGANKVAIQLYETNNIIIQNCSFNYSGSYAIAGMFSNHIKIINDSIQNSLCIGIYLPTIDYSKPGCDYNLVENNDVKKSGVFPGMGMGGYSKFMGIYVSGKETKIINNRVDSSGYIGIFFNGVNSVIRNNYVTNFCFIKDDGGGIYTVVGNSKAPHSNDGSQIALNVIVDGIGAPEGTVPSASPAAGIYVDDLSRQITIDSNTISNCMSMAILLNGASSIKIHANTIFNSIGSGLAIYGTNENIRDLNIKRNIILTQGAKQFNLTRLSGNSLGDIDSNYYAKPSGQVDNFNLSGGQYKLSDWATRVHQDVHSSSIAVDSGSSPLFIYNPEQKNKKFILKGAYTDIKGVIHKNLITLAPFTSAILFKVL